MDLQLNGRIAMITGPAKGMGAAITTAFAAEGVQLALVGRDVAAVEPVANEAKALGAEVIVVPCDLGRVDVQRTHWPFLRDRRIETYGDLTKRFIDD